MATTYQVGHFQLEGHCDPSLGNNPGTGKSTSGYVFKLPGGGLATKAVTQGLTAQSTMEAEPVSMAYARKEALYISNMLTDLRQGEIFKSELLYCDNTGALHVAGDSTYSS